MTGRSVAALFAPLTLLALTASGVEAAPDADAPRFTRHVAAFFNASSTGT